MAYTPKFKQNPSAKPIYSDFGDGQKENDPIYPPSPTMPSAPEYNEMGGSLEGLCNMANLAVLRMTNTAGTYSKVSGRAINLNFVLGASLATGDVVVTKNGTGDLTYQFTVGIIPAITGACVQHNHTTANTRASDVEYVDGRTIRVRTWNSGAAAEANYTLFINLCRYLALSRHSEC